MVSKILRVLGQAILVFLGSMFSLTAAILLLLVLMRAGNYIARELGDLGVVINAVTGLSLVIAVSYVGARGKDLWNGK